MYLSVFEVSDYALMDVKKQLKGLSSSHYVPGLAKTTFTCWPRCQGQCIVTVLQPLFTVLILVCDTVHYL